MKEIHRLVPRITNKICVKIVSNNKNVLYYYILIVAGYMVIIFFFKLMFVNIKMFVQLFNFFTNIAIYTYLKNIYKCEHNIISNNNFI